MVWQKKTNLERWGSSWGANENGRQAADQIIVAPSDIISNLFLEDPERIWELKKWIPDPCYPYLHYLKPDDTEEI